IVALIAVAAIVAVLYFSFFAQTPPREFVFINSASKNPISGLNVEFAFSNGEKVQKITGKDGNISLQVPEGKLIVKVLSTAFKKTEFVFPSLNASQTITLEPKQVQAKALSFYISQPDGRKVNDAIVELSCSNSLAVPESPITVNDGFFSTEIPENCGRLFAKITADGFVIVNEVLDSSRTIFLEAFQELSGSANAFALNEKNQLVKSVLLTFAVLNLEKQKIEELESSDGKAVFEELPVGNYSLLVSDASGVFLPGQKNFTVKVDESSEVKVVLSEKKEFMLKVSVLNKDSRQQVLNAEVSIKDKNSGDLIAGKTSNGSELQFNLAKNKSLVLEALHDDFEFYSAEFSTSQGNSLDRTIELKPCFSAAADCGKLEVKVLDAQGFPVDGAMVSIAKKLPNDFQILASKTTDYNGIAVFSNFPEADYFITASKLGETKKSEEFRLRSRQVNRIQLVLPLAFKQLKVLVKGENALPISGASVKFKTLFGSCNECELISNEKGEAIKQFRIDRQVFAIVSKQGFASFKSTAYAAQNSPTIEAILKPNIQGEFPAISLESIRDEKGVKVSELKAGKSYTARFLAQTPSANFEKLGVHLRLGREESALDDLVFFTASDSLANYIIGSSSYNPPNSEQADLANSASSTEFKWFNHSFSNPDSNTSFEILAKFSVSERAQSSDKLYFYFRSWLEKQSRFYRTPVDAELGFDSEKPEKQGLYADAVERIFFESKPSECKDKVCVYGLEVKDNTGFKLPEPFILIKEEQGFTLKLSALNGLREFRQDSNLSLRIFNALDENTQVQDLNFSSIRLSRAQGLVYQTPAGFAGSSLAIPIPNWLKDEELSLQAVFSTLQSTGFSKIFVQVYSHNSLLASEELSLLIVPENRLRLSASPEITLKPFMEQDLNFIVKDRNENLVENALVRVDKVFPSNALNIVQAKYTNHSGVAEFSLPALDFASVLRITASKPGFQNAELRLATDLNIASLSPKPSFTLEPGRVQEHRISEVLSNKLAISLKAKDAFFPADIDLDSYLKMEEMNDFLYSRLVEKTISPEVSVGFEAKAIASSTQALRNSFAKTASLAIVLDNNSLGKRFFLEFPASFSFTSPNEPITSVEGVEKCLKSSSYSLQGNTLSGNAVFNFEIDNNCSANLQNLQARIVWPESSKISGIARFSLQQQGRESSAELSQFWNEMLSEYAAGSKLSAILEFNPLSENLGKTAAFAIELKAILRQGTEALQAELEAPVHFNVLIQNLKNCVKFSPTMEEGVLVKRNDSNAEFSIDTSSCGQAIQVRLCNNDLNCAGGTSKGGIGLEPKIFSNATQAAKILRQDIPGYYGLKVEAKPQGLEWQELGHYPVIVEPSKDYYFHPEKFVFNFVDNNSDSASVFSTRVHEDVEVTATACDWEKAASGSGWGWDVLYRWDKFFKAIFGGGGSGGKSCDEILITEKVSDYIINLSGLSHRDLSKLSFPQDALSASLSLNLSNLDTNWNIENAKFYDLNSIKDSNALNGNLWQIVQEVNPKFKQGAVQDSDEDSLIDSNPPVAEEAGVIISRVSAGRLSKFDILELKSKEHIHGDALHAGVAEVFCNNGNFDSYRVGPQSEQGSCDDAIDIEHSEFFHIFLKGEKARPLHEVEADANLVVGTQGVGYTGKNALPKVKLDWRWTGKELDSCDINSAQGYYCDVTQFSMVLFKRLKALDDFLQENNYFQGICPSEETEQQSIDSSSQVFNVPEGKVGVSSWSYQRMQNTANFQFKIKNNSTIDASVDFKLAINNSLSDGFGEAASCIGSEAIDAGTEYSGSCSKSLAADNLYYAFFDLNAQEPAIVQEQDIVQTIVIPLSEPASAGSSDCSTKRSTFLNLEEPNISKFVREAAKGSGVLWNGKVYSSNELKPVLDYVEGLVLFNAWLVKDGFSNDFRKDFIEYYNTKALLDTPQYFKASQNGFWQFLDSNSSMIFSQKDNNSFFLPDAGRYRVELAIDFGSDWKLFSTDGKPKAFAKVLFAHLQAPNDLNPFYYIPFDGAIGLKNGFFERQDYGTAFQNSGNGIKVENFENSNTFPKAEGSNPLSVLKTSIDSNSSIVNSTFESRGRILRVDLGEGKDELVFSPSLATPLALKVSAGSSQDGKLAVFYDFLESGKPEKPGKNLAFWNSPETLECLDFSGKKLSETFNNSADRQASALDNINPWESSFGIDWESVEKTGNVFLTTVFYTNPSRQSVFSVHNDSKDNALAVSRTAIAQQAVLNGVGGMRFNDSSRSSEASIGSLEELFNAVESRDVFMIQKGQELGFWWNEKKLLSSFETSLQQELQSCIGS
ncbi:MAG: carboxypeptidase regulatory-like domain-containing protein, partial [Candidatus Diapherotrites archaeon]|nr:carboxypeptidase regulatory-like domain-containing protein [Candidatus Diapherotrites archaeon]